MAERLNTRTLPDLSRRRFAAGAALTGAMAALSTVPAIAAAGPNDDREEWLALYHAFCAADRQDTQAISAMQDAAANRASVSDAIAAHLGLIEDILDPELLALVKAERAAQAAYKTA